MSFSRYAVGDGHGKKKEEECEKKLRMDKDGVFEIYGTTDYQTVDGCSKQELQGLLQKLLPRVDINTFQYRCLKLRRSEDEKSVSYYAPIIAVQAPWLQHPDRVRRFPIIRGTRTLTGQTEEGGSDAALKDLVEAMKKYAIWDQAKDDMEIALSFNWSVDVTDLFGWVLQ